MKLIINGDDFGYSESCSNAIAEALRKHLITHTTMMANGESFETAVALAKQFHLESKVGIHFNLTEGKPLTAAITACAAFTANGSFDLCGFGREAIAYPDLASDILKNGAMKKEKLCMCCSKCTEIMRKPGGTPGCVLRDKEVYLPIYRKFCVED